MSECYLASVVRGTTWTRPVTWKDESGNPVNVTGYSARLHFRRGTALVKELSSPSDGITVGTTNGVFTLSMTDEETAELPVGTLDYDLHVTSGAGAVTRILTGALAVLAAITRDA